MPKSFIKKAQQLSNIVDSAISEAGDDQSEFIRLIFDKIIDEEVNEVIDEVIGQLPSE